MPSIWTKEEVATLSEQFKIAPGARLHSEAEDYHFPEKSFLAQGYTPPGGYVKDFSVIRADGRLHLFHIDGRPGQTCCTTGNEISFGHASTADCRRWIRHPMPLAVGDRPWETEHVWAPFVYRRAGMYYMFYMGYGRGECFISYATSPDLENWTRWEQGPIRSAVGRDPFVYDAGDKTVLLFTAGHGGARISGCVSRDMVVWEPIPDIITIFTGAGSAAESCSLHPLDGRYVLWFNDYRNGLSGFRAAYAVSDDPFHFNAEAIQEFRFITDTPGATPSRELPVAQPTPLSIELIDKSGPRWLVAYFRWHIDRNRLFFGSLDWSAEPAVIRELSTEEALSSVLTEHPRE